MNTSTPPIQRGPRRMRRFVGRNETAQTQNNLAIPMDAGEARGEPSADNNDQDEEEDMDDIGTDVNDDDMDAEDDVQDDDIDDGDEHDEGEEEEEVEPAPAFDPSAAGVKDMTNLGKIIVSTSKPGNGVEELRSDDIGRYWQSDGPQPHRVTVQFIRRVEIRMIRFYVDYHEDESYTPTRIRVLAGTGWHDLQELCEMVLPNPVGWQDVPIAGAGAGADGNSLACWIFQLVILENHQNGKDTHIRGLKVYGLDDTTAAMTGQSNPVGQMLDAMAVARAHRGNAAPGPSHASGLGLGSGTSHRGAISGRSALGRDYGNDDDAEAPVYDHEGGSDNHDILEWVTALEDRANQGNRYKPGEGGLGVPDFMRDPEIR